MGQDKIIQIISPPADMWAWYRDECTKYVFSRRVVCMALVENRRGGRRVIPMDIGLQDDAASFTGESNFIGFSFMHMEEDYPDEQEV